MDGEQLSFLELTEKQGHIEYDATICDECFYYGMDDESLSKNIVRFKCEQFKMLDYYVDLEAKERRKRFKVI